MTSGMDIDLLHPSRFSSQPTLHLILNELRLRSSARPDGSLIGSPAKGAMLRALVAASDARRIIELGVFTGYSAMWMASALPDEGYLLACDRDPGTLAFAEPYFRRAGLIDKIDFAVGPVETTLARLLREEDSHFDLAFIDVEGPQSFGFFDACLHLVREVGLIVCSLDELPETHVRSSTMEIRGRALQAFLQRSIADPRVDCHFVPAGEGLWVAKRL